MNFILPRLEIHDCAKVACAGGFFLNVKLNQKLWYSGKLDKHWIYPNAGDPGLSVGAALMAFHSMNPKARVQQLDNLYKGPDFSHEQIKQVLDERRIKYAYHENIELIAAELLKKNYVLGWFQGRMEAGPRALGNRSILVSPLKQENRDLVNTRIKYRETFRPFCPSILSGYSSDYLVNPRDAYYMVISFDTNGRARQRIPAVVHVDGTVRPQTVRREVNPRYYDVIKAFGEITGEYAILNTSLNIRGEPIVCTPREAIKCLYDTGMDAMILGNFLVEK
jgi:carbamoyltransferase